MLIMQSVKHLVQMQSPLEPNSKTGGFQLLWFKVVVPFAVDIAGDNNDTI
jgi:hypothetical protein